MQTETNEVPFVWDEMQIETMGQTMDAALAAIRSGRAAEFKAAYIQNLRDNGADDPEGIVNSNLGYMSGYFDTETSKAILEAFGTVHPVFGATQPTPEEALQAGFDMALKGESR